MCIPGAIPEVTKVLEAVHRGNNLWWSVHAWEHAL